MRTKVTHDGKVIAYTEGQSIEIDCAGKKMKTDLLIETAPTLEELTVTEDREYTPSDGKDGFSKVKPVLEEKTIIPAKSRQEVTPSAGKVGFSKVAVEAIPDEYIVPTEEIVITENKTADVTNAKTVTVNVPIPDGHVKPEGTVVITENDVDVDVTNAKTARANVQPTLEEGTATANGDYTPSEGVDGFSKFKVNVPIPLPALEEGTATANGEYYPGSGIDGFSKFTVRIPVWDGTVIIETLNLVYSLSGDGTYYICYGFESQAPTDVYIASEYEGIPVKEIGNLAFEAQDSIVSVTIPEGITTISSSAFRGCTKLKSVKIPRSITYIDFDVFFGCTALTSINYAGTVSEWNAITKEADWNNGSSITSVICTDGTITIE